VSQIGQPEFIYILALANFVFFFSNNLTAQGISFVMETLSEKQTKYTLDQMWPSVFTEAYICFSLYPKNRSQNLEY